MVENGFSNNQVLQGLMASRMGGNEMKALYGQAAQVFLQVVISKTYNQTN